jgi:hypothetical protein
LVGAVIGFVLRSGEKADLTLPVADCGLKDAKREAQVANLSSEIPSLRDRSASSPRARRTAAVRLFRGWKAARRIRRQHAAAHRYFAQRV